MQVETQPLMRPLVVLLHAPSVIQGGLHAAPKEDEVVPARQHVGFSDVRQLKLYHHAVHEGTNYIDGGRAGVDDAQRGIWQGDVHDLESAVAVEKQPRGRWWPLVSQVRLSPGQ
jgi:hypothetical protein